MSGRTKLTPSKVGKTAIEEVAMRRGKSSHEMFRFANGENSWTEVLTLNRQVWARHKNPGVLSFPCHSGNSSARRVYLGKNNKA